jgi:SnoaL-like domain
MSGEEKLAVAETLYRYARGVDTRDWALYRSIFADDVMIDFSSYGSERPPTMMRADDWVARLRPLFAGLAATQHSMSNPMVTLDGDRADITMYMQAHHVLDPADPDAWYTIGGHYDDTLIKVNGHWLITAVTLTVTWRRGNPAIMNQARAIGIERSAPQP